MKTLRHLVCLLGMAGLVATARADEGSIPSDSAPTTTVERAVPATDTTNAVPTVAAPRAIVSKDDLPKPPGTGPIYVIPVTGQIEGALVYVFRRGLAEAADSGARAIVLDMDTPGGNLDAIWRIMELLQRSPVPTYTFVNPNAISGGALIALATDHIVMTPGGLIGDAKPILGGSLPFSTPQEVPEGLREKVMSPALAKVRAVCQLKGRDERIGEAMMDETVEIIRDGKVINAKGKILTLTTDEAATLYGDPPKPLLSEGTFASLDELLRHLGLEQENDARRLQVSTSERIARILAGPLSPILLGLGLLLLYIEARTPGFGIPGLTGLLLMGLWFWGQHIAALAGMGEVIVFLLGVVLLAVEVFLIPGFGVTGVAGIVLIITSILMAMVESLPGGGVFEVPAEMLTRAVMDFTMALVVLSLGAWAAGGLLPKTPAFRRLTLQAVVDGKTSPPAPASLHPGVEGVTLSPCRPGGVGRFAGQRVDIVSTGEFLEAGAPVALVARRANTWEVRPAPNHDTPSA